MLNPFIPFSLPALKSDIYFYPYLFTYWSQNNGYWKKTSVHPVILVQVELRYYHCSLFHIRNPTPSKLLSNCSPCSRNTRYPVLLIWFTTVNPQNALSNEKEFIICRCPRLPDCCSHELLRNCLFNEEEQVWLRFYEVFHRLLVFQARVGQGPTLAKSAGRRCPFKWKVLPLLAKSFHKHELDFSFRYRSVGYPGGAVLDNSPGNFQTQHALQH